MTKTIRSAVSLGEGSGAGAERIRLLEAIRSHGSIAKAAKALDVSYRTAWDSVRTLNNLFERPLVVAEPGGREGGGATVTREGEEVIQAFHRIEASVRKDVASLQARLAGGPRDSTGSVSFGLGIKTSARNVLQCTVTRMTSGPAATEVGLSFAGHQDLTAAITNPSVGELNLAIGANVFALISPAVPILAREDGFGRTSARNRLAGAVMHREDSSVSSEIIVGIGGEKTLAVTITRGSADDLDLRAGDRVVALVKASQIILLSQ